jgi:hypothetical protein
MHATIRQGRPRRPRHGVSSTVTKLASTVRFSAPPAMNQRTQGSEADRPKSRSQSKIRFRGSLRPHRREANEPKPLAEPAASPSKTDSATNSSKTDFVVHNSCNAVTLLPYGVQIEMQDACQEGGAGQEGQIAARGWGAASPQRPFSPPNLPFRSHAIESN